MQITLVDMQSEFLSFLLDSVDSRGLRNVDQLQSYSMTIDNTVHSGYATTWYTEGSTVLRCNTD